MLDKKSVIYSRLKCNEIIDKLRDVTDSWHKESNKKQLFEGEISNTSFNIKPVFDFGRNDSIRPIIIGLIKSHKGNSKIEINFIPPKNFKILLIATISFQALIGLVMFWIPKTEEFPFLKYWWVLLLLCPLNYLMYSQYWIIKVNLSLKKLRILFK